MQLDNEKETYVSYSGDHFRLLKIFVCSITFTVARIIYKILDHFSKSSSIFSKVNHKTTSAILCLLDSLLDTEGEVWPISADIGLEYATAVTFIMDSNSKLDVRVGNIFWGFKKYSMLGHQLVARRPSDQAG